MKKCYKCKLEKPYDDFYKDYRGKYGLSSKCKTCGNKIFWKYYDKNKEEIHKRLNSSILCNECLEYYGKSNKYNHKKTKKHKNGIDKINNIILDKAINEINQL